MKKTIAKSTKNVQFKYYLLIFLSVFFLSGTSDHSVLALNLTVEAIEDAGLSPLLPLPFARFDKENGGGVLHIVPDNPPPGSQWKSAEEVKAYASSQSLQDWWLWSAGNIWSTDDKIVGESLTGLSAGTYRVSVVSGAFEYDAFDWNVDYRDKYWWQLHILGIPNGEPLISKILGSTDSYLSSDKALSDNLGEYVDITLPSGVSLVFWIWDWNSLDNAGFLEFSVTPIPEPATVILLGTGMLFLAKRFRRHSSHR